MCIPVIVGIGRLLVKHSQTPVKSKHAFKWYQICFYCNMRRVHCTSLESYFYLLLFNIDHLRFCLVNIIHKRIVIIIQCVNKWSVCIVSNYHVCSTLIIIIIITIIIIIVQSLHLLQLIHLFGTVQCQILKGFPVITTAHPVAYERWMIPCYW